MRIAGVDGCKAGWLCVYKANSISDLEAEIFPSFQNLLFRLRDISVIAVDIPIGLPTSGDRQCDSLARQLLRPPRASSVFPAPVAAVLNETEYETACIKHREVDGRALSKQAFAILPKIREVNQLLRAQPKLQNIVREVHPEACFAVWNYGRAMQYKKSDNLGVYERAKFIDRLWPGERMRFLKKFGRSGCQPDDLNDAFAALWSARRIAAGTAKVLGSETDRYGIKMQIWA